MTHLSPFDCPLGRISATSLADQLAGGEHTVPPCAFTPVRLIPDNADQVAQAAERHERLVRAAQRAPHGDKLRLQGQAYRACHQRLAAELAATRTHNLNGDETNLEDTQWTDQ